MVGLLFYMWKEANKDKVSEVDLMFEDFPKSFGQITVFFISDIHRRQITDSIVNQMKGKADLVIIGGDLTEKGVPFERVSKNLQSLKRIGPTYFVWGNNDYEVDYHQLDAILLEHGVKILDNTAVILETENEDKIILLGVDDMNGKRDRLDLALSDGGEQGFKILVSHNPNIIKKINKENRIRLVLSGHTHGGQIRLFNFGFYEKGKIFQTEKATLLISNGYGTTNLPLRLGAPAETHVIRISAKKS